MEGMETTASRAVEGLRRIVWTVNAIEDAEEERTSRARRQPAGSFFGP